MGCIVQCLLRELGPRFNHPAEGTARPAPWHDGNTAGHEFGEQPAAVLLSHSRNSGRTGGAGHSASRREKLRRCVHQYLFQLQDVHLQ